MTATSRLKTNATSSLPFQTGDSLAFQTGERNTPKQKRRKKPRSESLSISDSPSYLQIQSVPIAERVDPERNSYILVLQPVGIRAAAGQYSPAEMDEIAKATRGWDWSLDKDGKPQCLQRLEALLNQICKRSAKGGEA